MSAPVREPATTSLAVARPAMNLWRLEWLRLIRTHRWVILLGIYLLFAVLGALSARYLRELLGSMGGEMTIIAPDPRPVDGLIQFVSNTSQLGLLGVVVVAAAALAIDAHPERAAFLRTRMTNPGRLVLAPYALTTLATIAALVAGTTITVALTSALIGPLPSVEVTIGTAYGALYVTFAIAVVAAVAGFVRSQLGVVFTSVLALLVLPMLALVESLRPWLPSELLTAVVALVEGAPRSEYLRASVVAVVATAALLTVAMHRLEVREV